MNGAFSPFFIMMREDLNKIIAPAVAAVGYELLGTEFVSGEGRGGTLRIYIDSPNGITVDDCGVVSKQVSAILDVEDPIGGKYTLEVSSPGLFRPLFTAEQAEQFIGERIKVKLVHADGAGRRNYAGMLTDVLDDTLHLEVDGEVVELSWCDVEKASLNPELF